MLLVGYGNMSRRDDGVAGHILARLRQRMDLCPVELANDVRWSDEEHVITEDGPLGCPPVAMILLHQLAPELGEALAHFGGVVFIDAHVAGAATRDGQPWEPVFLQQIAAEYASGMVTHHLKPTALLALARSLYGRAPEGYVLSVLGYDFDFGEELSEQTSLLADQAVSQLWALLQELAARGRGAD